MSKGLLTIIMIACVVLMLGSLAYSIYNYIATNKRNRATERTNERLFMAETQKMIDVNKGKSGSEQQKAVPTYISNPILKEEPKVLDYDSVEDDVVETDKKLKDFFSAN